MPKLSTFPLLYDEVLTLSVSDLKRLGYLKNNQVNRGGISWMRNGGETANISVKINTKTISPYIELKYNYDGKLRNYKLPIINIPSNLGISKIQYFLCPVTEKRCRKLYLVNGFFLHRDASKGMYKKQTESKKWRKMNKFFENYYGIDDLYEKIHSKHFRTHYAGIPTKRYLRLKKKIEEYENMNPNEWI